MCKEDQVISHIVQCCEDCESNCPELLAQNRQAWKLWLLVNTQWRAGMIIIGLDYTAVIEIAKLYRINLTPGLFNKLKALELYELNRARKEVKKRDEQGSSDNY